MQSTIGGRVQSLMEEKGISQEDLAEMVNVTQMAISNLINGKVSKPRNILDIANALGVDPNWLQNGGERPSVVAVIKGNKGDSNITQGDTTNYFGGSGGSTPAVDMDRFSRQLDRIEQKLDFLLQHMMSNK